MQQSYRLGSFMVWSALAVAGCEKGEAPALAAPVASASASVTLPALPPGSLKVCERPESVQFDAGTSAWYVSCQSKPDVPGDGFIAKLSSAADAVVTLQFTVGLNEPKGIRIRGSKLYVTDVSELVTIEVATGRVLRKTSIVGIDPEVPAAPFLNDVALSAAGDVYVSDNRNNVLYRFDADGAAPKLLLKSASLEAPNGLLVDEHDAAAPRLLVAGMGPGLDPARGLTQKLGAVLAIALADLNDGDRRAEVSYISQRIGNLDGIELDGSDLLLTDIFGGRLLRLTPSKTTPSFGEGDARVLRQGFARSADLGFDPARRLAVVPESGNGTVVAIDVRAL